MIERGKTFTPSIPCLNDHKRPCIECTGHSINFENLRRLARDRYVRYVFSKEVADFPTIQQISDLINSFDEPRASIYSDSLGTHIFVSPELRKLGKTLADLRYRYSIALSNERELEFHCAVIAGRKED